MPANPKYLTHSGWQRFAKISAAILGGYLVTTALHLALAAWTSHVTVIITSAFSSFILWVILMVLAFLPRNGWKVWLIYAGIAIAGFVLAWAGKIYNPNFLN
ncbi:hypothetical protein [Chryseosolibacter indicus]|uniref:DUF3649 domain-containing protein n=1 Tax=Chryseosolibacter indicus TaxID=2782351 RepID=A0ABS5VVB9_9BACT|nr:hypothetical protein [Chryseosolibacter indicus]MBT1704752.1 hypothetical protein [Chryseosolibacter indicus]